MHSGRSSWWSPRPWKKNMSTESSWRVSSRCVEHRHHLGRPLGRVLGDDEGLLAGFGHVLEELGDVGLGAVGLGGVDVADAAGVDPAS